MKTIKRWKYKKIRVSFKCFLFEPVSWKMSHIKTSVVGGIVTFFYIYREKKNLYENQWQIIFSVHPCTFFCSLSSKRNTSSIKNHYVDSPMSPLNTYVNFRATGKRWAGAVSLEMIGLLHLMEGQRGSGICFTSSPIFFTTFENLENLLSKEKTRTIHYLEIRDCISNAVCYL